MYSEIDKQIMLKFLESNYPISRVKVDFKFKRAVVLEKGIYVLNDKSQKASLKIELIKILKKVFSCDEFLCAAIINNALSID